MEPLTQGDPARIGPFRLVARLGRGGMGRVYLARSESTGRAVAVKTVHGELLADTEFRTRFSHEVAAAVKVRDEYIAEVVDADPDGATPWLATAYVPGISVEDAVRRFGPLPADSVRVLGLCVAKAVAAIHSVGLVHRDLKPGNVLLTAAGPKVIDFGIARGVSEAALTRTGMVSGSPPYMAPEQLGYGQFSAGSDVFSLGAVLHYAATAAGPYGRGGAQEQYARAMGVGPVVDPALPDLLFELVRRCFAAEPAARPSTAEVVRALEAHPGERPLPGWLPSAVISDILAQATDALNKDSAAGLAAQRPSSAPPNSPPRENGRDTPSSPASSWHGPGFAPPSEPSYRAAQPQPQPQPQLPPQQALRPPAPFKGTSPSSSGPEAASAPGRPEPQSFQSFQPYQSQRSQTEAPLHPPPLQAVPHFRTGPGMAQRAYAPPPYPQQAVSPASGLYGHPHQAHAPSNGIATAALVLSLVGVVAPCTLLVALPLGIAGLAKARKNGAGHGQALAGTVVSSVLLAGWVALIAAIAALHAG
ncbi:protein kinase [Actinocrinis puniceicyclus]|uniref:Protein kinase n=1 Tax=Actinocrinis puniceicyclus TaxID=977794 RepID=A0A8J7WLQ2_9ACTN|nr:protein kinase [Actinocrinis puniceicyclus]MBS2962427.1 protein kinase [Actinocrinis puniceicyclus]